jgi:hypothetical protein
MRERVRRRRPRWVYWAAALALVLAVGGGSFLGLRRLTGDDSAVTAEWKPLPADWQRYLEEDAQKPRFNQEINGILVGPGGPGESGAGLESQTGLCTGVTPQWVGPEEAAGTVVDFNPSYLPEGVGTTGAEQEEVVECGGTAISVLKYYNVPAKFSGEDQTGYMLWSGGSFSIWRMLATRRSFPLMGAAERMGPISIAGRPGVLMRPIMPGGADVGFGDLAIVIAEDFGLTVIQGGGLPLAEFIKIAEGLY